MPAETRSKTAFDRYRNDLSRFAPLERREERRLLRAYAAGDRAAGDRVVLAHLRFVVDEAKKFVGRGVPFEDLVQEGNIGLLHALERFDLEKRSRHVGRSCRFISYAAFWVKERLTMAVIEKGKVVKVERKVQHRLAKLRKLDRLYEADLGRPATVEEAAAHLGLTEAVARRLRLVETFRSVSLDQPSGSARSADEEFALYAVVPAEQPAIDEHCHEKLRDERRRRDLAAAIETLDPRDGTLLRERLLREPEDRKMHRQLAAELGLSRSRVQQLEELLMRRLRTLMNGVPDRAERTKRC